MTPIPVRMNLQTRDVFRREATRRGVSLLAVLDHAADLLEREQSTEDETLRALSEVSASVGALEERVDVVETAVERFQSLIERSGSNY